jgi:excisionase family DNA binding protein
MKDTRSGESSPEKLAGPDYAFLLESLKRLANDPRVAAAVAEHEPVRWLRITEAARLYGISRSRLYELINDGSIRSCSLRKRGAVRGARRLLAASLDEYFQRQAAGGAAE